MSLVEFKAALPLCYCNRRKLLISMVQAEIILLDEVKKKTTIKVHSWYTAPERIKGRSRNKWRNGILWPINDNGHFDTSILACVSWRLNKTCMTVEPSRLTNICKIIFKSIEVRICQSHSLFTHNVALSPYQSVIIN